MSEMKMSVLAGEYPIRTHADLALALGGSEDSFTGQLLTLIAKADPGNRARLRTAFPQHVAAWEIWQATDQGALTAGWLRRMLQVGYAGE